MAKESVRIEGLDEAMKTLRALPVEMVSKNGGPVRFALRKAAALIQKQVQANIRQITIEPNAGDFPEESTGLLEKNIAIKRGKPIGGAKGEAARVYVKRKKYPKQRGKDKNVSTPQVSRLLEYGTDKMHPHKHWRPAFDSRKMEALQTFVSELNKRLASFVKKVARQNGAKL